MQQTDYPANLLKLQTMEKLRAELYQNKQMKEKATVCSVINVVSDLQIMADPDPVAIIVHQLLFPVVENALENERNSIKIAIKTKILSSKICFLVGNNIYLVVNNIFHRYNGIMGENLVMSFYYGPDSDFWKFQNFFCQKMSGWCQKFSGALI